MSVEEEHATEAAELHSLLRGILAKAPADRYQLEDLVRHEWVRGVGRNGVKFSPTQSEKRSLQPMPGPGPGPVPGPWGGGGQKQEQHKEEEQQQQQQQQQSVHVESNSSSSSSSSSSSGGGGCCGVGGGGGGGAGSAGGAEGSKAGGEGGWAGAWVAPPGLRPIEVSEADIVAAMTPVLKLSHVIAAKRSAHKIKIMAVALVAGKVKALARKRAAERAAAAAAVAAASVVAGDSGDAGTQAPVAAPPSSGKG